MSYAWLTNGATRFRTTDRCLVRSSCVETWSWTATTRILTRRPQVMRDGWFHSGDAAVVHPDGYIEIRDRFKDIIISGGENISSVEVEGALMRHPAVQEVAVVGMPDEKWGETPHAFVVRAPQSTVTEAELVEYAREHMAHFKAPRKFEFIDQLPKTATGKIRKYVLRGDRGAVSTQ